MATARKRATGRTAALRGIGNSLYTPFSGADGDDIDWDAYRTLVRYCVGDLGHPMLWCTSGIAEFWSLTIDERKRLLEVAIEEGASRQPRCRGPGLHVGDGRQGLPRADPARAGGGCRHRLHPDADDGGARRRGRAELLPLHRRSHRHRARHVQLAVVGLRADRRRRARASTTRSRRSAPPRRAPSGPRTAGSLHELAPDLVIWECDLTVYRAGWLRDGIVVRRATGHGGLSATRRRSSRSSPSTGTWSGTASSSRRWTTPRSPGMDQFELDMGSWFTCYPGRPDYFTHWGGAFKYAASVLGLPIGDYPHSRPPQADLPDDGARTQIRAAYRRLGLVDGLSGRRRVAEGATDRCTVCAYIQLSRIRVVSVRQRR